METKPVTDAELKSIESEVAKRQADALKATAESTAKEVESRVRKEMESKIESDRLKAELEKQQTELTKSREEMDLKLRTQQEVFEKRLQELEAQRKGIVSNQSPFDKSETTMVNGQEVDVQKLNLSEVEKASAEAFIKYHNLPRWYFEKTGQTKR